MSALIWLYGVDGKQRIPVRDATNVVVEDRLNDVETLKFTIEADSDRAPYITADIMVRYDGRFYRISTFISNTGVADQSVIDVECEALWVDLSRRSRVGATSILAKSNTDGLTSILAGTNWTIGTVVADGTLYSMDDLDATVVSLLRRWAGITRTELKWDTANRTVSLVRSIGTASGLGYRYGHNLIGLVRRYAPPSVTRLYAFGANNLDISNVNPTTLPYIEDFSWYLSQGLTLLEARSMYLKEQVWVDARYILGVNLYDAAVARLAALSQPTISYECKVLDLYSLTGAGNPVGIGDTVTVRDDTFGLDLNTRVVRIVRYPSAPWNDEIELSFLQSTISDVGLTVTTREPNYANLAVLVAQNDANVVTAATVNWATIAYTLAGTSNVVMGATFKGTATGTGTITYSLFDDITQIGAVYAFPFVAGQVEFSWPQFAAGLDEGSHSIVWKAAITSGSGTVAIAAGECRAWLLSQGAVGSGLSSSPNSVIEESLALYLYGTLTDSYVIDLITVIDIFASDGSPYTLLVPTHSGGITASAASGRTIYRIPSGS